MQRITRLAALALVGGLAAACSGPSLQQSLEPPTTQYVNPITQTTLQFQAGTAVIAGSAGLNSLETYRQSAGSYVGASILVNAPTIVGPAAFVVPRTPDSGTDGGTDHISGVIPASIANAIPVDTFNPSGASFGFIASSYGFFPALSTNPNGTTNLIPAPMPFYVADNAALSANAHASLPSQLQYIGGPPAFVPPGHTSTQDGTYNQYSQTAQNVPGFSLGVAMFQAKPSAGTYQLTVTVPTGTNTTTGVTSYGTKSAASTIALTYLPAWGTAPTFASDGAGGGTITTHFSGGSGIAQEYLELVNVGVPTASGNSGYTCQESGVGPYYYTFKVTPGAATVAVPDDIGAAPPGTAQPHTLCTAAENTAAAAASTAGDGWYVYGFAVDYPMQSSAFPASQGNAAPAIVGAAGQDDITTSNLTTGNSL